MPNSIPDSIIIYSSRFSQALDEDPVGTISILAPAIPWFLTVLAIMVAFKAIGEIDMWLWQNMGSLDNYHEWIVRGCYLVACLLAYCVYHFSHLYIWSY